METKFLDVTTENVELAAKMLAEGKLVAFPTETVYGLGADALNSEAVGKVYAAKGRPSDNPMIVHIAEEEELTGLTPEVTPMMKLLMKAFWPGPMTMVVPKLAGIPDVTTGGLDTVAVRMPSHPVARELIKKSGCPVAAPSANLSGKPSPTKAEHAIEDLSGRIDAVLMGEDCEVGIESTVVDVTGDAPVVLRPGIITPRDIEKALRTMGKRAEMDPALFVNRPRDVSDGDFKPRAPGMKYKHYAPKAEMRIISGEKAKVKEMIEDLKVMYEKEGKKVGIILFEDMQAEKAAHDFFSKLRQFDSEGMDLILAGALSLEDEVGFAVMNRMMKSAGYSITEAK